MKAMIFAAGLGTRLRPITDQIPKALVPVAGKPMLQKTIEHIRQHGFKDIIINVHHHADQIEDFLSSHQNFGLNISISDERDMVLETGGGLKKASWFLNDTDPFLVINSDVVTDIDLTHIFDFHQHKKAMATLVVRERPSSRYFLFDEDMKLCGWKNVKSSETKISLKRNQYLTYAFSGIHIIDPEIFLSIHQDGKFSIVDVYLELAKTRKLYGYLDSDSMWFDIGDIKKLEKAEAFLLKN